MQSWSVPSEFIAVSMRVSSSSVLDFCNKTTTDILKHIMSYVNYKYYKVMKLNYTILYYYNEPKFDQPVTLLSWENLRETWAQFNDCEKKVQGFSQVFLRLLAKLKLKISPCSYRGSPQKCNTIQQLKSDYNNTNYKSSWRLPRNIQHSIIE